MHAIDTPSCGFCQAVLSGTRKGGWGIRAGNALLLALLLGQHLPELHLQHALMPIVQMQALLSRIT